MSPSGIRSPPIGAICDGCGRTIVCLMEIVDITWTVLDGIILVLDGIILVEEALCEDLLVEDDVANVVDVVVADVVVVVDFDKTIEVVDTAIIRDKT